MIRRIALFAIRLYQILISPFLGPNCRFTPSCSTYTSICIARFGAGRGSLLGIKRLLRCHPFGPHGYDLPPSIGDLPVKGRLRKI